MPVTYRQIAGVSMERLAALSDGIFAVAMTLLVLGLSVQGAAALHHSNLRLWDHVLRPLWRHLLTYLMSFLTLGVFWVGQQTQLHHLRRTNRDFTWIHLVFLLFVVLMPFSTTLVADYITDQLAIVVYWLNIALLGAILYAGQRYARRARLLKDDVTAATVAAMERRIVVYQALRVNPVRGRAREDQQQADARRSDPGVRPVDEERVIGGQQGVCGRASKWTSESPSRATASPASSSSARTASWAPAQEESAASPRRAAGCWRACPSRRFGAAHEAAPRARA